jgi:cellulose biosynthesis protein BcsQ
MTAVNDGRIITFYSYKGGTGRSMALANVAWILASQGKRVLVLDWDLEAPGVHRYFYPFLVDQDLVSSEGVIDFVIKFATAAATPDYQIEGRDARPATPAARGEEKQSEDPWYKPYANILRYAGSLSWQFKPPGTLDFIPAGRQGTTYSTRVNSFNWQAFYEKLGGGELLELAKARMRAEYDYVLVDSRTGVSDTSGICTVQMPDVLAVCFTLNNQSIEGSSAVAASVDSQRRSKSGEPEVRVFPIPMRVEKFEKEKLELAREAARSRFAPFLWHIPKNERDAYWGQIETFYEPFYAYEEVLATFGDKPRGTNSMLASAERLTGYLTSGLVRQLDPPTDFDRERVLAQYARQKTAQQKPEPRTKGGGIFVCYRREDGSSAAGRLYDRLSAYFPRNEIFIDVDSMEPGVDFVDEIERSVRSCDVLIAVIGTRWLTSADREGKRRIDNPEDFVHMQIATALRSGIPVIPVLVDGASMPRSADLPDDLTSLVRRNALFVSHNSFTGDSSRLIAVIQRALKSERQPSQPSGVQSDFDEAPRAKEQIPDKSEIKRYGGLQIWVIALLIVILLLLFFLVTRCHA